MFLYTHRHSLATAGGMVEQQVGNLSCKQSHISKSAGVCDNPKQMGLVGREKKMSAQYGNHFVSSMAA
jgi:hypothetical protein